MAENRYKTSIPAPIWERAQGILEAHPRLGYGSVTDLIKDLLRQWCETTETRIRRESVQSSDGDRDENEDV